MIGFKLVLVRLIPLQYRILPSSAHWYLKFTGQKVGWMLTRRSRFYMVILPNRSQLRTRGLHSCVNHRIIKNGGWALTRKWVLTLEIMVLQLHIAPLLPVMCLNI